MDPRDPRFNDLRSRYASSFSPYQPPPLPPPAAADYYSHPQFHPLPRPTLPRHHHHEDSRLFYQYPESRAYDRREIRAFDERVTPDPVRMDRDYDRVRKDEFLKEELRIMVRKDEIFDEFRDTKQKIRLRIREDGSMEEDFDSNFKFEENNYLESNGKRKWNDFELGDEYFENKRTKRNFESMWSSPKKRGQKSSENYESWWSPVKSYGQKSSENCESEWSSPKNFGQKSSALGRIQSGVSVWSRIKVNGESLGGLEDSEAKINMEEGNESVVTPKGKMKMKQKVSPVVSKSLSDGLKKEVGCSSKVVSNGMKMKAIGSSGKATSSGTKVKAIGSSSMPVGMGPKMKTIGSSTKQTSNVVKKATGSNKVVNNGLKKAVGASSKPVAKKAVKKVRGKKVMGKIVVKTMNKNISEVSNRDDKVGVSEPTEIALKIVNKNISGVSNQDNKVGGIKPTDGVAASTENSDIYSVEEQSAKVGDSDHVPIDITTSNVNTVLEESSKDVNIEQVLMNASSEITIDQAQNPISRTTLVEKNPIETSIDETGAAEKCIEDFNMVQGSVVDDSVKEEIMKFVDKLAHDSMSNVVPNRSMVIDVSSNSSSSYSSFDESDSTTSSSKTICLVEKNDDALISEIDVGNTLDSDAELLIEGIEKQNDLVAPSVTDELEAFDGKKSENTGVLHMDTCGFVNDKNSPIYSPEKEDCNTIIFEENSVDVAMSKRLEQLVDVGPSQHGNLIDISIGQGCLNCFRKQQDENSNKQDKTSNSDSLLCSKELVSKTEMGTRLEKIQISADTKLTGSTKSIFSSGTPRVLSKQFSSASSLKAKPPPTHNPRYKTWHRTDTPSSSALVSRNLQIKVGTTKQPTRKQSPKKVGKGFNSSYVRKGNSLIRKPTNTVAHHPILPFGIDASRKKNDMQKETPDTQKQSPQFMLEHPITKSSVEAKKLPLGDNTSIESNIIKSEPLIRKKMVYMKHKSNQLVAAPTEKYEKSSISSLSSDIYYMRNKNQLIRNASSSENQLKQNERAAIDNSNLNHQGPLCVSAPQNSRSGPLQKRLDKVHRKLLKHSKFSRVWTLSGQSDKKVIPYLFPWKRTTFRKFSTSKTALNSNKRSLSSIGWKLQLARKRDTIYTVSNDGFSLRKAGVVSVGGSSLKWSKSIDKHSKKANEEATLVVAEVERSKRERKRKRSTNSQKKGRKFAHKPTPGTELQHGERVFRVGSFRYKMDASKRTLIRIGDEPSPGSVDQQPGKSTLVPRRLLIGNDEYIRKGNGSQLVRDPKKLVRMLASEKIRWSLHTARRRLAKKQQYCQFFTRFGKCNKNSGKCPYIHDPDKVAICTKFLRGACANSTCKLTHKIIPDRMPDCSYYLQGLCTNLNCPYRHVHVNPGASICEGFLRGYCADGDECRKKHSYVCPIFEATGKCPEGSKCKLHHPKNINNIKKRKHSKIQNNNSNGRYFGSNVTKDSEKFPIILSEKYDLDSFTDFISLNFGGDNDDIENNLLKDIIAEGLDSDISDMHPDELDARIKPVCIMNIAR